MSATCAICLLPIVARQDVRVSGTEVMHRACAAAGSETVGWRQQKEIADLRRQLVHSQESARRFLEAEQRANRQNRRLLDQVTEANNERDLAQSAVERVTAALSTVTRERDALRSEIDKRPVVQSPVVQSPSEPPPTQEEYGKDAEVRFSLLEL